MSAYDTKGLSESLRAYDDLPWKSMIPKSSTAVECASKVAELARENQNAVIYVYGVSKHALNRVMKELPKNAIRIDKETMKIDSSLIITRRADVEMCRGDVCTHAVSFETEKMLHDFYYQVLMQLNIESQVMFM